jgi:DNA-binding transcriptional MerR regulator
MAERSYLSIGEVLSLLQDDFPDVTISKIRFLESQGLLDPERTPSGYRKFYEGDIARLRWILRHQRDHFLPLKVMKDRLEEALRAGVEVPPDEPAPTVPPGPPSLFGDDSAEPEEVGIAVGDVTALIEAPSETPTALTPAAPVRAERPAPTMPELAVRPPVNPLDAGPTGVSFTLDELSEASGLTTRDLGELTRYGLLVGYSVAGETFYDGDALIVARSAAGFMRFGIEARHLRMYKVAAEREGGFMEQVVMPLLKQRNPTARQQAADTLGELAGLGEQLRSALLRAALRDHTDLR